MRLKPGVPPATLSLNMLSRDELIKVAVRIDRLRKDIAGKEAELKQAEAQLDFLLGGKPNGQNRTPMTARIVELLIQQPTREFTVSEVLQAFPDANENSVRAALPKLADTGRIKSTGRGRYSANNGQIGASPDYEAALEEHDLEKQMREDNAREEEESFAED